MKQPEAQCFPPVEPVAARGLILGSMPGVRSLEAQQYYAHPRNAFWPIMQELVGVDPGEAYTDRLEALAKAGFMLWDVLARCRRPGSLDARIEEDSIVVNDFAALYDRHPELESVYFNGQKAEQVYRKRVRPGLGTRHAALRYHRLPSTSPAYAGMPFAAKLTAWRAVLGPGG